MINLSQLILDKYSIPQFACRMYNLTLNFILKERGSRTSVSNESNVLLDPEVLPDLSTQALVLTVLATLVKYSTDEGETRVLYQYLAEGSVVFPKVFPVM